MDAFKNVFSPALVTCIATHLAKHLNNFQKNKFEQAILNSLASLELKARAQLIADTVHAALPLEHEVRYKILLAMLHPEERDNTDKISDEDGIRGWGIFPLTLVVGQYGQSNIESSLQLLKEMTKRFTSEFGIRDLIIADQTRALQVMQTWISDENHHVRRLISEGTRPRLPWGIQLPALINDPTPVLPLLTSLRDDKEEYVRRSVANHLNDISKDHPDLIAQLANEWMIGADKNREKLVRHACRSLIKQGHPLALVAFGIAPPKIELTHISLDSTQVIFGENLSFSVTLTSTHTQSQNLIIDYCLHFLKANGSLSPKVFKGKRLTLEAGESYQFHKRHSIKLITTRRYYEGNQALSLRINGQDFAYINFDLVMPKDQ